MTQHLHEATTKKKNSPRAKKPGKSPAAAPGDKDYSARYGRTHTIGGHRYEDANTPYAPGSGRTIYATEDYDDEYLARRIHHGER